MPFKLYLKNLALVLYFLYNYFLFKIYFLGQEGVQEPQELLQRYREPIKVYKYFKSHKREGKLCGPTKVGCTIQRSQEGRPQNVA